MAQVVPGRGIWLVCYLLFSMEIGFCKNKERVWLDVGPISHWTMMMGAWVCLLYLSIIYLSIYLSIYGSIDSISLDFFLWNSLGINSDPLVWLFCSLKLKVATFWKFHVYNPCLQDTYNHTHPHTHVQYQLHDSVFSMWDDSESQAPYPWPLANGTGSMSFRV